METGADQTGLAASMFEVLTTLVGEQPWVAVGAVAGEVHPGGPMSTREAERARRLASLRPSLAVVFRDHALAGLVPGIAQRRADAILALVAAEIEVLGVLDHPHAETAGE